MRLGRYPDNLKPGIYRVYWKGGGASIAAVGVGSNGDNWIAPTNWIEPATSRRACYPEHPEHWSWATVERVEFVTNDTREDDEEETVAETLDDEEVVVVVPRRKGRAGVVLSIRLTGPEFKRLSRRAEREGVYVSSLARSLIVAAILDEKP